MRRTCFVCYGADGKKNSLTYHEISRKIEGDEFFLFLSWSRAQHEPLVRDLYRKVVSSSRLGHPSRFFRELAESGGSVTENGRDQSWLEESCILMVWRRGVEVFLLRNKKIEPIHFDQETGKETSIESLEGRVEIGLTMDGSQADLFAKRSGDNFKLDQFRLLSGGHTLLFAPSRDFIRRNKGTLLDSVLFPSFEVPVSGELEIDTVRSLGVMHWGREQIKVDVPEQKKRGVEIMKASVPMAAGAVALVLAILLIFKPFGGDGNEKTGEEDVLLSPAQLLEAEEEMSEQASTVGAENGDQETSSKEDTGESSGGQEKLKTPAAAISLVEGWKKKFDGPVTSSPVICGERVVFGCRDGNLYCFGLDGGIKWKYTASEGIGATPACIGDMIVGADYEGNAFCLSADDGKRIWNYRAGAKIVSSPVARKGAVVICTMDGRVISLDLKDGVRKWSQKIGDGIWATPAVGDDYIVAASTDGSLVRMTLEGKVVWRVAPGGEIYSSPLSLEKDDLIIVGTGDRYILAYSLSAGALMWRYGAGSEIRGVPVASSDRIITGTEDGTLIALDRNGVMIWKQDIGGAIRSKPLILDDMVAVTSYKAKLSLLMLSTGEVAAEYRADAPIYSSPAFHKGRFFFGSNGGFLHAPAVTGTGG